MPNSKAWGHIDKTWPEFGGEPRNVRLRFATDGVNPFGEKSNAWSTSLRVVLELQPSTLAGDQKVIVVVINDNPWPKQCEK